MNIIEVWFDGVCEDRNPGGHAAYGILVHVDGKAICARGEFVGVGSAMSNNVAEYSGFCAAMEYILEQQLRGVCIVRGDSALVIRQLNGEWRVRGGLYLPYYMRAKSLLASVRGQLGGVQLKWIPRKENAACDYWSKKVLLDMGVKFRIQPEEVKLENYEVKA